MAVRQSESYINLRVWAETQACIYWKVSLQVRWAADTVDEN